MSSTISAFASGTLASAASAPICLRCASPWPPRTPAGLTSHAPFTASASWRRKRAADRGFDLDRARIATSVSGFCWVSEALLVVCCVCKMLTTERVSLDESCRVTCDQVRSAVR